MTRAFVFPGQGAQSVGMGRALYDAFASARAVYEEVDDALGQNLSALIFEGPNDELTLTQNAQPALMTVSMAAMAVLREGGIDIATHGAFVAGHSLGEYTALCAAGTFTLADTARLLRTRGRAMQEAVPVGAGAMAALLGLDWQSARAVAEEAAQGDVCAAANDNADGQAVISGTAAAVDRAIEIAKARGAKKCVLLPVSAPFHCALMQPAAEVMAEALADVEMRAPSAPLIANVSARSAVDADEIRDLLVRQVTGAVRWRESILAMKAAGVDTLLEVGAGKVLSGLARRIDRDLACVTLNGPEDIEAFAATL
ncbi:ACP S-malonyltransferase [Varunaivibrio sulfuroxidans]|uniref:Malonyl CoA-acyl carrier protein transacylase n=1 Tax=Varunaivibrio sulfuroxidans TaxID=1773489 RepID=A0A4R3J2T1_9PROT|nr:ACP S-malonyltransferase [Varunaivibrio sulfuroxidans]TCS60128.1 [acyl-carrier-protein] S-malonyltransferase [Varunaivibrio sulfuroxidans]WES30899.1 ACP S-malonyltransferase [Varunaivibrio sulfuroxidans]